MSKARNPNKIMVLAMRYTRLNNGRAEFDVVVEMPDCLAGVGLEAMKNIETVIGEYVDGRTKSRIRRVWEALR